MGTCKGCSYGAGCPGGLGAQRWHGCLNPPVQGSTSTSTASWADWGRTPFCWQHISPVWMFVALLCWTGEGIPGRSCHVNDINVYLGRQGGGEKGSPNKECILFALVLQWVVRFPASWTFRTPAFSVRAQQWHGLGIPARSHLPPLTVLLTVMILSLFLSLLAACYFILQMMNAGGVRVFGGWLHDTLGCVYFSFSPGHLLLPPQLPEATPPGPPSSQLRGRSAYTCSLFPGLLTVHLWLLAVCIHFCILQAFKIKPWEGLEMRLKYLSYTFKFLWGW